MILVLCRRLKKMLGKGMQQVHLISMLPWACFGLFFSTTPSRSASTSREISGDRHVGELLGWPERVGWGQEGDLWG